MQANHYDKAVTLLQSSLSEEFNAHLTQHFSKTPLELSGEVFKNKRLPNLVLDNVNLESVKFIDCNLRNLRLRGNKPQAEFINCALQNVNFEGSDLSDLFIRESNLTGANFATVVDVNIDHCITKSATFSKSCKEPFLNLCRHYTGHNFLLVLTFTLFSLAPFILQGAFWVTLSRTQADPATFERTASALTRTMQPEKPGSLHDSFPESEIAPANPKILLEDKSESNKDGKMNSNPASDTIPLPHAKKQVHTKVWRLVTGLDTGLHFFVLTIILLLYNAIRGAITIHVNRLRAHHDSSFRTPSFESLVRIGKYHRVTTYLSYFAIAAAGIRLLNFMLQDVTIFQ